MVIKVLEEAMKRIVKKKLKIQKFTFQMSDVEQPTIKVADIDEQNEEMPNEEDIFNNAPNHEKIYQVIFGPPLNTKEETEKVINEAGFSNMTNLQVFDKHCFIRSRSKAECDAFIAYFDKRIVNGIKMFASESKKQIKIYPPCTRLCVAGYGTKPITDRDIYNRLSPYGYIKHIAMKQRHAFVDFDTVEDAKAVMEALGEVNNEGSFPISLAYTPEAPPTDFTDMVMPLTDLLPPDHKFWQQIISLTSSSRKSY